MCFSASASFAAGAVLAPAGLYCTQSAIRKARRYLPLALVPVAFSIQQVVEGFVWLAVNRDDSSLLRQSSLAFLFFAIAFWPCWIPFSMLMAETRPRVKWLLGFLSVVGLAWAIWIFWPVYADPQRWLSTEVVQHSIRYDVGELPAFQAIPRPVWRFSYVAVICISLAVARYDGVVRRWESISGGVLVAILFVVSYLLYWYAFLSVWCFFAALSSLFLCSIFFKLPPESGEGMKTAFFDNSPGG